MVYSSFQRCQMEWSKKKKRQQKWLAVLSGLDFTQAMLPKGIPDVPDCLLYHLSRGQAQSF